MEITSVQVRKQEREGSHMKAKVSIVIDDAFVIHDIRIIEGVNRLFVAMPSKKIAEGEYKDIAHPIRTEVREQVEKIILDEYNKLD